MIQRIEVEDFESHAHTILDDLSPGLNLFVGDSNAGKTSIVRALKLASYNEFEPKSIRIGSTKVKVSVTTDRGKVVVTRGPKNNLWDVTLDGQPTKSFDKVGVNVVPEATEVMGMNMVRLGDVDIPVNIMDQLESHFMLKGIGDKDATGSMRAQIIDEISGLSGIEGLIKSVGLDHHRFGREVKESEIKMEETRKQLHDEGALRNEEAVLKRAEVLLKEHDEYVEASKEVERLMGSISTVNAELKDIQAKQAVLPDFNKAMALIIQAENQRKRAEACRALMEQHQKVLDEINRCQDRLRRLPDVSKESERLARIEKMINQASKAEPLIRQVKTCQKEIESNKARLSAIQSVLSKVHLDRVAEFLEKIKKIAAWQKAFCVESDKLVEIQRQQARCVASLRLAEQERDELMKSIKTCPLSLRPVSKECVA